VILVETSDKIFALVLSEIDHWAQDEFREPSCLACCFLLNSSNGNSSFSKTKGLLVFLMSMSFLIGIAAVSLGVKVGLSRSISNEGDLMAYILFGFGIFTLLVSGVGLAGLKKESREYLRVVCLIGCIVLKFLSVLWNLCRHVCG